MSLEWASFAVRLDGPASKTGYGGDERALREGTVYHSMEGSLSVALEMLANPALAKSWTFSNPKRGQLIQHYAIGKHAWANGSKDANEPFFACESEGGGPGIESEPLTESQIDNLVELTVWAYTTQEWTTLTRRITLWEHRELQRFGSRATACPSNRIPWSIIINGANAIIEQPEEEDMYALIVKKGEEQGTNNKHRTYLWRSGSAALLHMKSRAQREQTALLFGISDSAIVVSQATLDAL